MPDAKSRAQWCHARAREFLRLSTSAESADLADRYKDLAETYARTADREEELTSPRGTKRQSPGESCLLNSTGRMPTNVGSERAP